MSAAEASAQTLDPSVAEPTGRPWHRLLAPFAVALALLSAFLTFVVLTGLTPIAPTHEIVVTFLLINGATILLLLGIIAREVWQVVQARRRGRAAARLHVQIVSLFSVIAVLPAVLVSIVANVTIDRGLDRLFSVRTRAVIENSLIVANAYVYEPAQLTRFVTKTVKQAFRCQQAATFEGPGETPAGTRVKKAGKGVRSRR